MTWQPIATAPRDGTQILLARGAHVTAGEWLEPPPVYGSEYHANGTYLGEYVQGPPDCEPYWMCVDGGFAEDEPPTHWMPLPPPPTAEKPNPATCPHDVSCAICGTRWTR